MKGLKYTSIMQHFILFGRNPVHVSNIFHDSTVRFYAEIMLGDTRNTYIILTIKKLMNKICGFKIYNLKINYIVR